MLSIVVFSTFTLAGESLETKVNKDAFYFMMAVLVILISVVYKQIKARKIAKSIGVSIPLLFVFYVLFIITPVVYTNWNNYQPFNQSVWMNSEKKPFKMANTLTKKGLLIGLTKQEVIQKLGKTRNDFTNENDNGLSYWTDEGWELKIFFNNNKVTEAYLYQPGFDL